MHAAVSGSPEAAKPVQPGIGEPFAVKLNVDADACGSSACNVAVNVAAVPMVVAYRLSAREARLLWLGSVPSIVLPNLILGENAIPEFVHKAATVDRMAPALAAILADSAERRAQELALARLDTLMATGEEMPTARAARVVIETYETKTGRRAPRS